MIGEVASIALSLVQNNFWVINRSEDIDLENLAYEMDWFMVLWLEFDNRIYQLLNILQKFFCTENEAMDVTFHKIYVSLLCRLLLVGELKDTLQQKPSWLPCTKIK